MEDDNEPSLKRIFKNQVYAEIIPPEVVRKIALYYQHKF